MTESMSEADILKMYTDKTIHIHIGPLAVSESIVLFCNIAHTLQL